MRVMLYASAEVPGGLLEHLRILARGLLDSRHDLHVVLSPSTGADAVADDCASAGADVTRLTVRGKYDVAGMIGLRRLVARERPGIFHAHLSSPVEALPALLSARWGGAQRIVTTEHAPGWHPLRRRYSRAAKRRASGFLDAVIAVSSADARYLREEFDLPDALLRVIPNGVAGFFDLPPRADSRSRLGLPEDAPIVIGCAGALEEKKGILDLIEASSALGVPGLVLALAGAGSLESDLRSRAGDMAFRLAVLGHVGAMDRFMASIDIFTLPSHQEAMPLVLLEAMSAARPVVATRVGGIPEVIEHESTGLLVEPSRPEELASALRRLAGDPDLRARLGGAARDVVRRRHGAARMVHEVESLYREVIESGRESAVR